MAILPEGNIPDPPCDEHDRRIAAIRVVTDKSLEELAVIADRLERMDKRLFGNGQPGVVQDLQKADSNLSDRVNALERWKYILVGGLAIMQFLSGSGVVSLKGMLGH